MRQRKERNLFEKYLNERGLLPKDVEAKGGPSRPNIVIVFQGRRPTEEFIRLFARALQLSPQEEAALFVASGRAVPHDLVQYALPILKEAKRQAEVPRPRRTPAAWGFASA